MIDYRYEILGFLGRGQESSVSKALDHQTGEIIAMKIIKSKKKFVEAAQDEIALLTRLNEMDANEEYGIDNAIRTFVWRKHYVIVQELMESNLKKYIDSITDEDTKEDKL